MVSPMLIIAERKAKTKRVVFPTPQYGRTVYALASSSVVRKAVLMMNEEVDHNPYNNEVLHAMV